MVGWEPAGGGSDGLTGGAAADPTALGHYVGATGAVNGTVHASAAAESRVGSVHDGVDLLDGDIALNERHTGLSNP